MSAALEYAGGYLADDREMRLRATAPVPCRLCRRLSVKFSVILDKPVMDCGLPEEDKNAWILSRMLMHSAQRDGTCEFMDPFKELL